MFFRPIRDSLNIFSNNVFAETKRLHLQDRCGTVSSPNPVGFSQGTMVQVLKVIPSPTPSNLRLKLGNESQQILQHAHTSTRLDRRLPRMASDYPLVDCYSSNSNNCQLFVLTHS